MRFSPIVIRVSKNLANPIFLLCAGASLGFLTKIFGDAY